MAIEPLPAGWTVRELIDDGWMGTCPACGRVFRVSVPRGRFFQGTGDVRRVWAHKGKDGKRCPGSREWAREWSM